MLLLGLGCPWMTSASEIRDNKIVYAVELKTLPSKAMLYLDGEKIGVSPKTIFIDRSPHESHRITALPFFEHQYRQDLMLSKGSLPEQVHIFMDISPKRMPDMLDEDDHADDCSIPVTPVPAIFFDSDSALITEEQRQSLKQLACFLKNSKTSPLVNVYGQADRTGSSDYNYTLALKRANAVKTLLVEHGYAGENIKTFSYGTTSIKDRALNLIGLEYNRRTLIEITASDVVP